MKTKTRKQRFRELQVVVNQGLNASIIELAQEYLRDFPTHGLVWLEYGNALVDFCRYREARTAILRAIKHMPAQYRYLPYFDMGKLYESMGNFRRTVEWYKKALETSPKKVDLLVILGAAFLKIENISEAERCFRQAVKSKEGATEEAYYNLGLILAAQGKYKQALACLEKSLELDPKSKNSRKALKDMKNVLLIKGTSNKGR